MLACACAAAALAAAGCGGNGGGSARAAKAPNPNDKRATALACLTGEKHLPARALGADTIQIGDAATGPRVKFFLTGGQAEAYQFEGRAEGSEQIGRALLFTRRGSDKLLADVEDCLDNA